MVHVLNRYNIYSRYYLGSINLEHFFGMVCQICRNKIKKYKFERGVQKKLVAEFHLNFVCAVKKKIKKNQSCFFFTFFSLFFLSQRKMAEENILFQDIFDIKDVDPNGKRFDRGRIEYHI